MLSSYIKSKNEEEKLNIIKQCYNDDNAAVFENIITSKSFNKQSISFDINIIFKNNYKKLSSVIVKNYSKIMLNELTFNEDDIKDNTLKEHFNILKLKNIKHDYGNNKVSLVMMVKNEEKRIIYSLQSVKEIINSVVILDTGSTDETINIITKFCKDNNIALYLKEQSFGKPFNFSTARNVLLDYADIVGGEFLLLLDSNDEAKNAKQLREQIIENYDGTSIGFYICQEWFNGKNIDKYYNMRLVKNNHGWRYKGAIHEYILSPLIDKIGPSNAVTRIIDFVLYQDRTMDNDKSIPRFTADYELFEQEYNELKTNGKKDSRNLFYFAQTCMCLGKFEQAYKLSKMRTETEDFKEEKFHSYLRCGDLGMVLNHPWEERLCWYLQAYSYSGKNFEISRAEPLFKIAEYYHSIKDYQLSYLFLERCCELKHANDALLFWDRAIYDKERWVLLADVAHNLKMDNLVKTSITNYINLKGGMNIDVNIISNDKRFKKWIDDTQSDEMTILKKYYSVAEIISMMKTK